MLVVDVLTSTCFFRLYRELLLHDSGLLLNPSGHFRHLYSELPGLDAGPIYTKQSCGTATRSETLSLAATLVQVNEAVSTRSEFDAVGPVSSSLKRRRQRLIIISNNRQISVPSCVYTQK